MRILSLNARGDRAQRVRLQFLRVLIRGSRVFPVPVLICMYESRVLTMKRAEEHEGVPRLFLFLSLHSDYFRYPEGPHELALDTALLYAKTSWK